MKFKGFNPKYNSSRKSNKSILAKSAPESNTFTVKDVALHVLLQKTQAGVTLAHPAKDAFWCSEEQLLARGFIAAFELEEEVYGAVFPNWQAQMPQVEGL